MKYGEVLNGQTLFDIALQYCGSIEAAFDIASLNDMPVTSSLRPGETIRLPDVANKRVVNYFKANGIKPATAFV